MIIDRDKYPGRYKYRKVMGDNWLTVKEIAFDVGSDASVVNTVLRRWEAKGLVERRTKIVTWGKAPLEWRWKNG